MKRREVRYHNRMDVSEYRNGILQVQCYNCKDFSPVFNGMYRCFDCGVWLCYKCVPGHFSNSHEPHPLHLHEYVSRIDELESKLAAAEALLKGVG